MEKARTPLHRRRALELLNDRSMQRGNSMTKLPTDGYGGKRHVDNVAHAALLRSNEAAALLGISPRHLHALRTRGEIPPPILLGASVRWSRSTLMAWLETHSPDRVRREG